MHNNKTNNSCIYFIEFNIAKIINIIWKKKLYVDIIKKKPILILLYLNLYMSRGFKKVHVEGYKDKRFINIL